MVKVCFGSEGVWSVFLAYFTGSPGDHPLHEARWAPVPLTSVGAGGCINHEQQHPAATSQVLHT